jgi:hypothetical protein
MGLWRRKCVHGGEEKKERERERCENENLAGSRPHRSSSTAQDIFLS